MSTDTVDQLLAVFTTLQQSIDAAEVEQKAIVARMAALLPVKKGDTATDPSRHGGGPFLVEHLSFSPASEYQDKPVWYARGAAIRADGTPGHRRRSTRLNMDGSPA